MSIENTGGDERERWHVQNITVPDDWGIDLTPLEDEPFDTKPFEDSLTALTEQITTVPDDDQFDNLTFDDFPKPQEIAGEVNLELSKEDQPTPEDLQKAILRDANKAFIHPDARREAARQSTIWEKARRFIRDKAIGRNIGRAAIVGIAVTSALFMPNRGSNTTNAEQRTPVPSAPAAEIPTTQTEDTILIAPEAKPAQPIKQDLKLKLTGQEPQVITLRVTEKDNTLWEATQTALSVLPQYQNIPVPAEDIQRAINAAIYLKTLKGDPNSVNLGDTVDTVVPK